MRKILFAAAIIIPLLAHAESAIQGKIQRYLLNPHGEVDGLFLSDGTQVHFPPHLSADLTALVKPGDAVTVLGFRPFGAPVVKAFAITNPKTGRSIEEREPAGIRPLKKRFDLTAMKASGKIVALTYSPHGEINGAVLEDGTQIRVPPHGDVRLEFGAPIHAEGFGTVSEFGRAFEATALGAREGAMVPLFEYGPAGRKPAPHRP